MTWRRFIFASLGLILVVALVAIGLLNWVVRSESGTRWVVSQIEQRAGDVVSMQRSEGTLASGITIFGIRVETQTFEVSIDQVEARISLRSLLDRSIDLPELIAGQVIYRQKDPQPGQEDDDSPPGSFELPFTIDIDQASIQSLQIDAGGNLLDIGATTFSSSINSERLVLADLRTSGFGASVEADLEIELQGELSATAGFSWSGQFEGVDWAGSGSAAATTTAIEFEHQLQAPFELVAEGRASLGMTPAAQIDLSWQALSWPGEDRFQSPTGQAEITGWIDAFDAVGTAEVVVEGISIETDFAGSVTPERVSIERLVAASEYDGIAIDAEFVGSVTPERVSVERLVFDSEYGSGEASGAVNLNPLNWDLLIAAIDLDPSGLIENWPAAIALEGRLQGAIEPELNWSLNEASISGNLLDLPLSVTGGVVSAGTNIWRLDEVDVDWGGNKAFVDGAIDQSMNLTVRLNAPRLGALSSVVDGQLTVDGIVGGTPLSPSFTGSAVGQSLMIGATSVERIALDGTVSGREGSRMDVAFTARNIQSGQPIAENVSGTLTGMTELHEISIEIDSPIGLAELHAAGGWINNGWIGEVDRLTFDQARFGLWELEQPARLSADLQSVSLERGCLRQASASLCAEAEVGGDDERLRLALESFELSALQFLVGDRIRIDGTYDVDVGLAGPFDRPTGTLAVVGESTLISVSETEAPLDIPIERVEFEASLDDQEFVLAGRVFASADARIEFAGTVAEIYADDPAIDFNLDGGWADLGFLSLLSPDIGRVSGAATLSLGIGGSFDSPEVRGEARWTDGQVVVPEWGLVIDDVNLVVSTPDVRRLQYQLTGATDEGRLELTGVTELDPDLSWPTRLTVRGENFNAVQLPEAQINVSPNLEVVTAWPLVEVTGDVAVPFARLTASELPTQTVTTSGDVVVHGREAAPEQRPLDVRADLRLVLGSDVRFSGSGLETALTGEIGLAYTSGENGVATGTVIVNGEYATLGQTLELDQGRLIFSGPIADPIIDVRAVKRFEGDSGPVVAGVVVSGTVNRPVTRLYSEPSMSDGDIVSYLVVGRPLSDSSRENSEALQAAALSMGLTQALPQIQHFGEAIGLDELNVRASNASTGELMAGKQISPRMYMRYTYGLMNRVGGLLLRFQLSDRLSLETRTGEQKAMDLLYMVERE